MPSEIGGYLEMETFHGQEYHAGAVGTNNARNALLYILRAKNIEKLYIPAFLCGSVAEMLTREGIDYQYYHVGEDFLPVPSFSPKENAPVYLVNYYGLLSDAEIARQRARFHTVIVDYVQAFFQCPPKGVDAVYSCRKFFGVPDGGYALTDARLEQPLEKESAMHRMGHLLGRFETGFPGAYYSLFQINEAEHDRLPLRAMSAISQNLLRAVDYDHVRTQREKNYAELFDLLQAYNGIQPTAPIGPYAYPFYSEHGQEIRAQLIKDGIFIPVLWPDVKAVGDETECRMAENILPLPCDQRYGPDDMRRIADHLIHLI